MIALGSSFLAHIKVSLSKRKAKKKLEQLEREAAEQDKKVGTGTSKLRKRDINWATFATRE